MTKVDIDLLLSTANTVRINNTQIRNAFDGPSKAVSNMDVSWSGGASQNAIQAFYKLRQYCDPRYTVLENFAKALDTIARGYVKTEETNESLAERFK